MLQYAQFSLQFDNVVAFRLITTLGSSLWRLARSCLIESITGWKFGTSWVTHLLSKHNAAHMGVWFVWFTLYFLLTIYVSAYIEACMIFLYLYIYIYLFKSFLILYYVNMQSIWCTYGYTFLTMLFYLLSIHCAQVNIKSSTTAGWIHTVSSTCIPQMFWNIVKMSTLLINKRKFSVQSLLFGDAILPCYGYAEWWHKSVLTYHQ